MNGNDREAILWRAVRAAIAAWEDGMEAERDRRIAAMLARGILVEAKP